MVDHDVWRNAVRSDSAEAAAYMADHDVLCDVVRSVWLRPQFRWSIMTSGAMLYGLFRLRPQLIWPIMMSGSMLYGLFG